MVKAGRPQGGPKGQSEQANALANFVRALTKDFTVRELAERYKISKTSWGEYRSGAKLIHLHLLKRLVHDLVRDERTRIQRWEDAQSLHAAAVAAQRPVPPANETASDRGVTPREAVEQATATLQDTERLVHLLLGVIAGLQMQLSPTSSSPLDGTKEQPGGMAAASDLEEAESRLVQVRLVQSAVTRVRDEAATYDIDPAAVPPGAAEAGRTEEGTQSLPARYATASREAAVILLVSRAALAQQHEAVQLLSARSVQADTPRSLPSAPSPAPALAGPPRTGGGAPAESGTPRRSWQRLPVVVAALVLTATVSGAAVYTVIDLRNAKPPAAGPASSPASTPASPSTATARTPSALRSSPPSPSASPAGPAPNAPAGAPGPAAVPKTFIGTWEGEFTEPGERTLSLRRIVVREGTVGTAVAHVLTLSRTALCQSQGTVTSAGASLTIGPGTATAPSTGPCDPTGDISLRSNDADTLTWTSGSTTTTLHHAASADRAVPTPYLGTWRAQDGNDPTSSVRMTIQQGPLGQARAEFSWDGDIHHCKGVSILASTGDGLKFGPETVTASEPAGFCTQTPSRIISPPQADTMHVEWFTPPDGSQPRAFAFHRAG
ncbi:hypothetical protein DWB77_00293 [Streptomyces hundungensis]|uniref:Uncharacterized protein n=1 Tax=Streptomyces hundungensis TaxID=1077946 RepID=A0A387H3D5_9ACTN|nr:hypothetical protein [Streptomyces hundungensis]AYG78186.1 hypothetical protein DWB77_00293 [Streptomyces hundungensis]